MAKNLILWLVIAVVLMSVFQSFTPSASKDQQVEPGRPDGHDPQFARHQSPTSSREAGTGTSL